MNPNFIEITDVDDIEIYLETLRLMYCQDVRRSLIKENVSRVLDILKVNCAAQVLTFSSVVCKHIWY